MGRGVWLCAALAAVAGINAAFLNSADSHAPVPSKTQALSQVPRAASGSGWGGTADVFGPAPAHGPTSAEVSSLEREFLLSLAVQDPALRHARALHAYNALLQHAPERALFAVGKIPVEWRQGLVLRPLIAFATDHPDRFAEAVSRAPSDQVTFPLEALAELARVNPAVAAAVARRIATLAPQFSTIRTAMIERLIRASPSTAGEILTQLGADATVEQIQQAAGAWAASEPDKAYRWAQESAASRDAGAVELLEGVSRAFAAADLGRAKAYAANVQDPVVRDSLVREIGLSMGASNLDDALQWVGTNVQPDRRDEAVLDTIYRWSNARPEAVAAAVSRLTDPDIQAAAATHLARFWSAQDPQAYRQWLATLPEGALRARLVQAP